MQSNLGKINKSKMVKVFFGFYIGYAKGKYIFGFSWLNSTKNKSAR